jgi:hypothetical protein
MFASMATVAVLDCTHNNALILLSMYGPWHLAGTFFVSVAYVYALTIAYPIVAVVGPLGYLIVERLLPLCEHVFSGVPLGDWASARFLRAVLILTAITLFYLGVSHHYTHDMANQTLLYTLLFSLTSAAGLVAAPRLMALAVRDTRQGYVRDRSAHIALVAFNHMLVQVIGMFVVSAVLYVYLGHEIVSELETLVVHTDARVLTLVCLDALVLFIAQSLTLFMPASWHSLGVTCALLIVGTLVIATAKDTLRVIGVTGTEWQTLVAMALLTFSEILAAVYSTLTATRKKRTSFDTDADADTYPYNDGPLVVVQGGEK